jgi:hypothetical protein
MKPVLLETPHDSPALIPSRLRGKSQLQCADQAYHLIQHLATTITWHQGDSSCHAIEMREIRVEAAPGI